MAAAETLAPVKSKDPKFSSSSKGSVSSLGREDTFPVDKPAEKESTFTVDSTEKTKEKTKVLEERRRSQFNSNLADDSKNIQSKMAKGKDKDKGKKGKDGDKKGSDAQKPGSAGKDPPKDNSSKDNGKDKQDVKKTNSENEKPDASTAGDSEKQTDSKTNDDTPPENKGEKDDPAKKPDAGDDQGSAMGNTASTEDDKKQMSSSQVSLGSKSRRNSFLNAKHVTSVSLKKDANDADGSRRGSAVSGKDGKDNPDSHKDDEGEKPAETDTKEPDTVIESPKGGPTLDEDKGEEKAADEPKPEEKERTDADSDRKGKAGNGDKNSDENKTNTEDSDKKDEKDVGDGDKKEPEKSASPEVSSEKQKETGEEVKEEVKGDPKAPVITKEKEEEKPPTPKPKTPAPEPKQEPKPEKEETKKKDENDDKPNVAKEKKEESDRTREKDREAEKSSERAQEKEPEAPSKDTTREADGTKPDSFENNGNAEEDGKDVEKERTRTMEDDNADRTDGAPHESNSDDQVDNAQSRENTDIEGVEESDGEEEDRRKELAEDEKVREPTPRKRPTPTPRTPKSKERNVPNHPSSRPTQREPSEPIMRERTPAREPPRHGRGKDYPGKPTRVENPPRKGPNKNTPREENEPPPDNTKYKPNRKISDMSDSDTNQGRSNRGGNWGERGANKPFGRSSQMGPAKKRQSYSDDPNSDLEMRTPRSKPKRGPQPYTTGNSPRYEGSKASPRYEKSPRYEVPKKSPRYKPQSPELEDSDSSDPFLKFDRNSENLADLEKDTMNVLEVIRNMQDENRRAMSENSKLREKNIKLHQTVGELRGEMDELYEEKEDAQRRLAEEGKKENYVRKLEKDMMNAEHDRQKYLAKIQVLEDESRKQQRRIADKDTEISVAIGELQQLQRENEKLLRERVALSSRSPRQQRHRVAVTEVSDAGTQTFHSEMDTDGDVGMADILKQEVKSLKDYNSHLQKSLREEMSRRELVQSLLDDVMTTNEGFRKHVVKIADSNSEVDSLTTQLREMEVSQRKMMTENTQLKASLTLLEAQKQKDDAIEEILTGRSSMRDRSLEKRLEEMEQKLRLSEHRVVDLEGYLDQIYNNDDVKIVIRSDQRSNVTDTSLPNGLPALMPSVYPDRSQPSAFTKVDLNAYNSYARLAKNKTRFTKRF
ncbi:zinc finger CCCH domain-containing protein 13-like [Lineus longissimus]|uniref:zinc finger CCCH domain-containing protein 13-like n=1 Tax=Lineus longissimus TaxID=88925 RepID=UPI00315DD200